MVERVVDAIDRVVRVVRFDGWQNTLSGDQQVAKELRRTLHVKYKLRDQELFDWAHEHIREYY